MPFMSIGAMACGFYGGFSESWQIALVVLACFPIVIVAAGILIAIISKTTKTKTAACALRTGHACGVCEPSPAAVAARTERDPRDLRSGQRRAPLAASAAQMFGRATSRTPAAGHHVAPLRLLCVCTDPRQTPPPCAWSRAAAAHASHVCPRPEIAAHDEIRSHGPRIPRHAPNVCKCGAVSPPLQHQARRYTARTGSSARA